MKRIITASENTLKILGREKSSDSGYRLMSYCIEKKCDDGVLIFNPLTRELVLLNDEEYSRISTIEELRKSWMLVPTGLKDRAYADQVRFVKRMTAKKPDRINTFTIFPTTDCNARCFYCYELGRSRKMMSDKTARDAAEYISQKGNGQKVKLKWFGGEPLFNRRAIEIITSELEKRGIEFSSSMTTNGFLFDEETVKTAAEKWKLKSLQITLDGTEAVYNKSKAYINCSESAYRRVIRNIDLLLKADVTINIRLNLGKHNSEDLFKLIDELYEQFNGEQKLRIYSHVLFEHSGPMDVKRDDAERQEIYDIQKNLEKKIHDCGFSPASGIARYIKTNYCMADSRNSVTILPDGELGVCEHFSEDNFIGSIYSDKTDSAVIKEFAELREAEELCSDCPLYPECLRLKKCPESCICYPQIKQSKIDKTLTAMENEYRNFIRNGSVTSDSDSESSNENEENSIEEC